MGIQEIRNLKEAASKPKEPKKRKPIAKKSAKKLKQEAEEKKVRGECDTPMQQWFNDRRKDMSGYCSHCGGRSCKNSDTYFRFSVAHILPQRLFDSVSTHPDNWIELCHFGNSCHTNMDNNMLDMTDMACWNEIVVRFQRVYPHIAKKERKNIPGILLQYINTRIHDKQRLFQSRSN